MYSCLSPGAIQVSAPRLEDAAAAARLGGFDAVELDAPQAAARIAAEGLDAVRAIFDGLRPGAWGLPVEFRRDEERFRADLAALPAAAEAASALGVTRCATWILPMSNELTFEENRESHRRRLTEVARILADHGVRLGLEFVGPKTLRAGAKYEFVSDAPGMLALARDCGPNVGLLVDSFHWYTSGGDPAVLRALTAEDVVYVHLNDGAEGRSADEQIDNDRRLPGATGVIALPLFLSVLREIGYNGPAAVEPFYASLGDLPSDAERLHVVRGSLRQLGW